MQPAVGGIVVNRSVATRPSVERIEKEEVVDRAEVVILDPRLSAVCRVKEGVACGPAMERIDESDRVHLARHFDNCPCPSGIGRVCELADVSEERRRSDPALGWRNGRDSL